MAQIFNTGDTWKCIDQEQVFNNWAPITGRSTIVWPGGVITDYARLHNYYGFSFILLTDQTRIQNAISAGFDGGHIIFILPSGNDQLWYNTFCNSLFTTYGITNFYVDEPSTKTSSGSPCNLSPCPVPHFPDPYYTYVLNAVHSLTNTSTGATIKGTLWTADVEYNVTVFPVGEYFTCCVPDWTVLSRADIAGNNSYKRSWEAGTIQVTCDNIQQDYDDFWNHLTNFKFVFMTDADTSCYGALFGKISALGLPMVAFYCGDNDSTDWSSADTFAITAYNSGYLTAHRKLHINGFSIRFLYACETCSN